MEEILVFFSTYGWQLALIAIAGIIVLGILKYCNLFKKIEEKYRHYIYIGISVGLSLIATVIYFACVGKLTADNVGLLFGIAGAIYALNQTFYNIFKVTPINKLAVMLLDWIKSLFANKEVVEQVKDLIEDKKEDNKTE